MAGLGHSLLFNCEVWEFWRRKILDAAYFQSWCDSQGLDVSCACYPVVKGSRPDARFRNFEISTTLCFRRHGSIRRTCFVFRRRSSVEMEAVRIQLPAGSVSCWRLAGQISHRDPGWRPLIVNLRVNKTENCCQIKISAPSEPQLFNVRVNNGVNWLQSCRGVNILELVYYLRS